MTTQAKASAAAPVSATTNAALRVQKTPIATTTAASTNTAEGTSSAYHRARSDKPLPHDSYRIITALLADRQAAADHRRGPELQVRGEEGYHHDPELDAQPDEGDEDPVPTVLAARFGKNVSVPDRHRVPDHGRGGRRMQEVRCGRGGAGAQRALRAST